jgi:hypothetical protein
MDTAATISAAGKASPRNAFVTVPVITVSPPGFVNAPNAFLLSHPFCFAVNYKLAGEKE